MELSEQEYTQLLQLFQTKTSVNIELAVALLAGFGMHPADFFIHLLLEKDWSVADYLERTLLEWHDDGYVYLENKLCNAPYLFSKFVDNFFAQQSSYRCQDILINVILTYFKNRPKASIMEHFATYLDSYGFDSTLYLCKKWLSACPAEYSDWDLILTDFLLQSNFKERFLGLIWKEIKDLSIYNSRTKYFLVGTTRALIEQQLVAEGFDKIGLNVEAASQIRTWARESERIESKPLKSPLIRFAKKDKQYAIPRVYYESEIPVIRFYYKWTFVEQQVDLSPFMRWETLRYVCKELNFIDCTYVNLELLPNFPKLRELVFEDNRVLDFQFLNQYTFSELEYLSISGNQVEHFPGLNAAYFPKLRSLSINFGCLQSLEFPEKFPNLQYLNISKIPPTLQTQAIKKLAAFYDLTTLCIYL